MLFGYQGTAEDLVKGRKVMNSNLKKCRSKKVPLLIPKKTGVCNTFSMIVHSLFTKFQTYQTQCSTKFALRA